MFASPLETEKPFLRAIIVKARMNTICQQIWKTQQ